MELYAMIFFGLAQFLHHFNYTRQMTTSESETYVHDAQKQRTNDWKKNKFSKSYLLKQFRCKFGIIVAKTRFFDLWSIDEQVIIIKKFLLNEMRQTRAKIRHLQSQ